MGDSSSFAYEDGTAGIPQTGAPLPTPAQYRFSPEEMRVLKECNAESFMQRSMPLGTFFGLATYFGVQKGHLKPNVRFGAFPKVTLAVVIGYFVGKISYQRACGEKLMALPGSYIGQLLRDRKEGKFGPTRQTSKPMLGAEPGDIYSDAGPGNSLDLDIDRPLFSDDSYRPNSNIVPPTEPSEVTSRSTMSYDELRSKNRDEYSEARRDPYRIEPSQGPVVRRSQPPPSSTSSTNKYGDVME